MTTSRSPSPPPSRGRIEELPDAATGEFLRFFDGEMDGDERDAYRRRLDADPDLKARFAAWRRAGDLLRMSAHAHAEPDWARFHARLDARIDRDEAATVVLLPRRRPAPLAWAAGALALAAGLAALLFAVAWAVDDRAVPAVAADPLAGADADPVVIVAEAAAGGVVAVETGVGIRPSPEPESIGNLVESLESVDSSVMISSGSDQTTVIWVFEH